MLLLILLFLLGRLLQKSLVVLSFQVLDQDEIWQECSSGVRIVLLNTRWLTESYLWYYAIDSGLCPWRLPATCSFICSSDIMLPTSLPSACDFIAYCMPYNPWSCTCNNCNVILSNVRDIPVVKLEHYVGCVVWTTTELMPHELYCSQIYRRQNNKKLIF